ncbi:Vesicle-mediated ER to Golgi transport protein, partial [Quaeritorhiza haematococci]
MELVFKSYQALRGDKGAPQSATETIDKLCDRVSNSTLLEDRRAAVMGLKGLVRDWKLDVGTKGMPVLINVLQNDRMDVEIIKAVLETLNHLCSADEEGAGQAKQQKSSSNLGVMFTEIYIKDPRNVHLLLDILEEVDFYVRFYSVQLLATLLNNMGPQLQDCILTSPMGISRLIDLLDDRREIIRNEGLLLLISLTQSNADIQKIIAFENAFERLLAIIVQEGATDGGIIVQDCLQLTHNLLRYNVSNQNLFRETSCIHRIPYLLMTRVAMPDRPAPVEVPLTHELNSWDDEQKILNTILVLELVRILVGPNNPNTGINQNVMNQAHVIEPIIDLALKNYIPVRVRTQALYTLGDIIRGNPANQDLFSKTVVTSSTSSASTTLPARKLNSSATELRGQGQGGQAAVPKPAVLAVIRTALGREDYSVRAAGT